ncbi:MAG TPA: hypothetical protein VF070_29215 [Streptosporangiaceae bacterium]
MIQTEDRLRDAYRAVVQAVGPEDIPELPLPRPRGYGRTAGRNWAGVVMPLGAAAAVVALIVTASIIVPRFAAGTRHARGHAPAPAAAGRADGSLPEFTIVNSGGRLQVVETTTGRVTGTLAAPPGQSFAQATGAADDRTFLVAADLSPQPSCQTFLYRFTLDGTGRPSGLSSLPVPAPAGTLPTALAVNAAGHVAALSQVTCATGATTTISNSHPIGGIHLIDLGTGQVIRTWSYSLGSDTPGELSMSADGSTLTFPAFVNANETVARVLAASAPSEPTETAARIVVRQPAGAYAGVDGTAIAADGRTLFVCTHTGSSPGHISRTIAAYDAASGQQLRVLRTWTSVTDLSCGISADPSGGSLLVAVNHYTGGTPSRSGKRPGGSAVAMALNVATGALTTLPIHLTVPAGSGSLAW